MPRIEVEPGVFMHYQDRGSGDPIVFVHGWGGSGDVFDLQVLDLAPDHRCITVDLRGHGDSDKPWGDYNFDLFVRDLDVLIDSLHSDNITLVGWSMGGQLSLKYAHEHGDKVARLVITGSGPRFHQADDAPYGAPADSIPGLIDAVRIARTETIAGLYGNNFHRTDLTATKDWFVQIGWRVPAFVGLTSFQALVDNDFRSLLPEIAVPLHIFSGRHDQIWAPEWSAETHRLARTSTLTYFENSGHVAFVENRVEWNAALTTVINGGTPPESAGVDSVAQIAVAG